MAMHNVIWLDAWALRHGRAHLTPEERWSIHARKWRLRALRIAQHAVGSNDPAVLRRCARLLWRIHDRKLADQNIADIAAELVKLARRQHGARRRRAS